MSRILFLTPQLPEPPHQGAAIRNLNLLKIAARQHEVAVYSFIRSPEEEQGADRLRRWYSEVRTFPAPKRNVAGRALRTVFSPTPDMGRRLQSSAFAQAVRQAEADIVQAEGIEMVQYLARAPGHKVFDCHNAEWVLQRRTYAVDLARGWIIGALYSLLQCLKLRRYERQACRQADAVIAVSDEDRNALKHLDPTLRIDIVPNGVDASAFQPAGEPENRNSFLFTGTLDFRPNVDAVRWLVQEIWPRIRREMPNAELTIAGRAPVDAISRLNGRDGIRVEASPADIRPFFANAVVYLAPLRAGGGSRFKLLEAMAMGAGIVSTTLGAEGLAIADGKQVRLADTPPAFAEAAVALAGDARERRRLGAAARDVVLKCYDWPVLAPALLKVYEELAGGSSPTAVGEAR